MVAIKVESVVLVALAGGAVVGLCLHVRTGHGYIRLGQILQDKLSPAIDFSPHFFYVLGVPLTPVCVEQHGGLIRRTYHWARFATIANCS